MQTSDQFEKSLNDFPSLAFSTLGVNFINNMLRAAFWTKVSYAALLYLQFLLLYFRPKEIGKIAAHKMYVGEIDHRSLFGITFDSYHH